jgi:sialidase-1
MPIDLVLSLTHGPDNPRNSEGAFEALADGRLLFAYSRYYGTDGADHGAAQICGRYSADGGRSWTTEDTILVENEGRCNVMSVSLLRLQDGRIGLWYVRKHSLTDCHPYLRTSRDEGRTWSRPTPCIPAPGYFVVNNDRVVQLRSGRLVLPASYHRAKLPAARMTKSTYSGLDFHGLALFYLSDDGGRTWREGQQWLAFPGRSGSGLQEPGVVELQDGRLYGHCRTDVGRHYEMLSEDGGETWTSPRPSIFQAPMSPLCIKRLPATGDLLAVWNDHSGHLLPQRPEDYAFSWARSPLVLARSTDDGATWTGHKLLEDDSRRGFCYTAIYPTEDAVLLAYCCGSGRDVLSDSCIRRVTLEWLYET